MENGFDRSNFVAVAQRNRRLTALLLGLVAIAYWTFAFVLTVFFTFGLLAKLGFDLNLTRFQVNLLILIVGLITATGVTITNFWWVAREKSRFIASLQTAAMSNNDAIELQNLSDGVCLALGISKVRTVLVNSPAVNTLAYGDLRHEPILAVTTQMADTLNRPELEALVASQLCVIGRFDAGLSVSIFSAVTIIIDTMPNVDRASTFSRTCIGILFFPYGVACIARHFARKNSGVQADRDAVSVTGNPLALLNALQKCEPLHHKVGFSTENTDALWTFWSRFQSLRYAPEDKEGGWKSPITERIAALQQRVEELGLTPS